MEASESKNDDLQLSSLSMMVMYEGVGGDGEEEESRVFGTNGERGRGVTEPSIRQARLGSVLKE